LVGIALAALATLTGVAASQGQNAEPEQAPKQARAAKAPKVELSLPLTQVQVTGTKRVVLHARPAGKGTVHWLRPRQQQRSLDARAVATVLDGVHERDRERVSAGGHSISIGPPKLKRGGSFSARIHGAAPNLPGSLTLRAQITHTDRRTTDGCPLAPFVSCRKAQLSLDDLHRADLRGADLRGASLHSAWAHDIELAGADLRGADLRAATLTAADLRGANLKGAHLADANLQKAKVKNRQLRQAHLCNTRLPSGKLRTRDCDEPGPSLAPPRSLRVSVGAAIAGGVEGGGGAAKPDPEPDLARADGAETAAAPSVPWPKAAPAGSAVPRGASDDCPYEPLTRDRDEDGAFDCDEISGATITVQTFATLGGEAPEKRKVTSKVGKRDTDGDGVVDGDEYLNSGDPRRSDTDADHLNDVRELNTYKSSLNHADTDDDSLPAGGGARDPRLYDDSEACPNISDTQIDTNCTRAYSAANGTNLRNADTDGDSLTDFHEIVQGNTNPRVANLPHVALGPYDDKVDVQIDLGYEISDRTGQEKRNVKTTQTSNKVTSTNETSHEASNALTHGLDIDIDCEVGIPSGCSEGAKTSTTKQHGFTSGSSSSYGNTKEAEQANQQIQEATAEHEVKFDSAGCLQVRLQLENTGNVPVNLSDFQIFATTFDPRAPSREQLLATLLPVNGSIYEDDCPATDSNWKPPTIPPHSSTEIALAQQIASGEIRDYLSNPTPMNFEIGAMEMTGTNLAGGNVNFLGDVATDVEQQTAAITVDFGNGNTHEFSVAARSTYGDGGRAAGVRLGDVLGPALLGLAPQFGGGKPSQLTALTDPESGTVFANDPARGFWNLVGEGEGVGDPKVDWADVVVRPGSSLTVAFTKDTDGDRALDDYETLIGSDPTNPDTDGDGLNDWVETVVGWSVPMKRGNQAKYRTLSNPLSCDIDGDGSPDGPGPGNATHGPCPASGYPPEATRALTTGDAGNALLPVRGLEGTDPLSADTNTDGLLDGLQPLPDVLKAPTRGARVPLWIRQWGGPSDFESARAIALDRNQPLVDDKGALAPVDHYVINRVHSGHDRIVKFTGNPLSSTAPQIAPISQQPNSFLPSLTSDLSTQGLTMAATGIAVRPGVIGDGSPGNPKGAPPVAVNYYPKAATHYNANQHTNYLTTFNGTSGVDVHGQGLQSSGRSEVQYGSLKDSPPTFWPPAFHTGARSLGNGFVDATANGTPIIAHGFGADLEANLKLGGAGEALPTQWLNRGGRTFGSKPKDTTAKPAAGELIDPQGLAVDRAADKLYVSDDIVGEGGGSAWKTTPGTVTRFDQTTKQVEAFLPTSAGLKALGGVAADPSGEYVYVASQADNYIYKLTDSLSVVARFGGPTPAGGEAGHGTFAHPWDMDVDSLSGIWATDRTSNLIQYFFYPLGPN
jgi:hypothetical protein